MKRIICRILLVIFLGVFLVSGYCLIDYMLDSRKQIAQYDELAKMVAEAQANSQQAQPTTPKDDDPQPSQATNPSSAPTAPVSQLVTVQDPETGEDVQILSEYAPLYLLNNDLVGWIQIKGANIDYPVLQTPDQRDYYLYVNFQKESSKHGCIYVREECDVAKPSDNVTIYGHRMQDGSMFAGLNEYISKDFWEQNKTFTFDTLTEHHTYEIIAVFRTSANIGQGFSYHRFVDAANAAEFDSFVATCKSLAYYDTGLTAEYGDKLICLSTCEYTLNNGRLVVVAKRIA